MFLMFIVFVSGIIFSYAFNRLYGKIRTQDTKKSITRRDPNNDQNLISDLPDSVICHILSKLSTKEAVRTSVLSKNWKHKWTTMYKVDIRVSIPFLESSTEQTFNNFTDKIVKLPNDLKSFRLSCYQEIIRDPEEYYNDHEEKNNDRIMEWVSAASRRKVESFEFEQHHHNNCVIPISLLASNTSLRTLRLTCTLKVSLDNIFPHLTDLYLHDATILNEQSNASMDLAFTFPVLKTLSMQCCKWQSVKVMEIYSPALRTFICDSWDDDASDHEIKIFGAKLEYFRSSGVFLENIYLEKSTVHKAELLGYPDDPLDQCGFQVRTTMSGCFNLAELTLSSDKLCEAITQSYSQFPLPKFDMLLRLDMCFDSNAELIFELLHCSPSLKFLKLSRGRHFYLRSESFEYAEVDSVPYCVQSHLEEVEFSIKAYNPLIRLAGFFLNNGTKLKKVIIDDYISFRKEVIEQIRVFPKASAGVEILYKFRRYSIQI